MLARQAVGLLCLALLAHAQSAQRVIPDYDVDNAHYPFFVQIMYRNYRLCGGTIINTRYILTSGGCVEHKSPHDVYVVVGAESDHQKIYETEQLIKHRKLDNVELLDVGLLRTVEEITYYKGHVEAVTLRPREHYDTEDAVVSYGRISTVDEGQLKFQWHATKMYNQYQCHTAMRYPITYDKRICTYGDNTTDWCFGLKGSPLLINNLQIGIAIYRDTCQKYSPSMFARVDEYFDWIQEHIDNYTISIYSRSASNSGAGLTPSLFIHLHRCLSWMMRWFHM